MVFILGVNFPEQRLVKRSLEGLYGIGRHVSKTLLARFSIHPTARIGDLSSRQVDDLTAALTNMSIENDLRRKVVDNIRRLRDMGAYRGKRHAMGLPVRGQRTRSQILTAMKLNKIDRKS